MTKLRPAFKDKERASKNVALFKPSKTHRIDKCIPANAPQNELYKQEPITDERDDDEKFAPKDRSLSCREEYRERDTIECRDPNIDAYSSKVDNDSRDPPRAALTKSTCPKKFFSSNFFLLRKRLLTGNKEDAPKRFFPTKTEASRVAFPFPKKKTWFKAHPKAQKSAKCRNKKPILPNTMKRKVYSFFTKGGSPDKAQTTPCTKTSDNGTFSNDNESMEPKKKAVLVSCLSSAAELVFVSTDQESLSPSLRANKVTNVPYRGAKANDQPALSPDELDERLIMSIVDFSIEVPYHARANDSHIFNNGIFPGDEGPAAKDNVKITLGKSSMSSPSMARLSNGSLHSQDETSENDSKSKETAAWSTEDEQSHTVDFRFAGTLSSDSMLDGVAGPYFDGLDTCWPQLQAHASQKFEELADPANQRTLDEHAGGCVQACKYTICMFQKRDESNFHYHRAMTSQSSVVTEDYDALLYTTSDDASVIRSIIPSSSISEYSEDSGIKSGQYNKPHTLWDFHGLKKPHRPVDEKNPTNRTKSNPSPERKIRCDPLIDASANDTVILDAKCFRKSSKYSKKKKAKSTGPKETHLMKVASALQEPENEVKEKLPTEKTEAEPSSELEAANNASDEFSTGLNKTPTGTTLNRSPSSILKRSTSAIFKRSTRSTSSILKMSTSAMLKRSTRSTSAILSGAKQLTPVIEEQNQTQNMKSKPSSRTPPNTPPVTTEIESNVSIPVNTRRAVSCPAHTRRTASTSAFSSFDGALMKKMVTVETLDENKASVEKVEKKRIVEMEPINENKASVESNVQVDDSLDPNKSSLEREKRLKMRFKSAEC